MTDTDLIIVGGGVMGLFTAYYASELGRRVSVFERGRVGDPATASYGRTRSYRNDYLDPTYVRLAREAIRLWDVFEAREQVRVLVRCGCLNIANSRVTPDLDATYARMSHRVLEELGMPTEALGAEAIRSRFPDLDADVGQLDAGAGVVDLAAVRETLTRVLAERGVHVEEGVEPTAIARGEDGFTVTAGDRTLTARSLVVTAGHGTNDVLARLSGCALRVPIEKDRPSDARYFDPPPEDRHRFTADAMPVIAYLDAGIYCHPIVPGVVDAVKVGYYNPPDVPRGTTTIDSIDTFVAAVLSRPARHAVHEGRGRRPVRLRPRGRRRLRPRRHPRRGERLRRRRLARHRLQVRPVGRAGARRACRFGGNRLRHRPLRSRPFRGRNRPR